MEASLDDDFPVGWVLTYRSRRNPAGCSAGVVCGPPEHDEVTGARTTPLAPLDSSSGSLVWVADGEVLGIGPRPEPRLSTVDSVARIVAKRR